MPHELKIALVGAGSRSFGPATMRDILLSDPLCSRDLEIALMDVNQAALDTSLAYARNVAAKLGRKTAITATTSLTEALEGAAFVVDAVEISRDVYWVMDFHIPRKHGFRQIYGENGGPGSHFHALRNMPLIMGIVREMERICPQAILLNYTNPMHKLCEVATRLSKLKTVGLCHGVMMGLHQIATILDRPAEELETAACGINHFTWFQKILDKKTSEDLYPTLRERERQGDWLSDWHEIGLSRVLFRRLGLYPSPGANHIGEYIGWADEFYASELHWFYDPVDGHPWQHGVAPEFVYSLGWNVSDRPFIKPPAKEAPADEEVRFSGEAAIPIIEAMACDLPRLAPAVNVPNRGTIPGLPDDLVIESPANVGPSGIHTVKMAALPEMVASMIQTQAAIQRLLVEAYAQESKEKLLEAILLEPTVGSYRRAVEMVDEMLTLQKDMLPPLH